MARLAKWFRIATLVGAASVLIGSANTAVAGSGTPEPVFAKANHEKCVEDNATMIRHHPDYLKHQRDETMYKGIRTTKYSLKKCMECHAEHDSQKIATGKTDCDSCHAYAAVKLDCWDCHAKKNTQPRPGMPLKTKGSPLMSSVQPEGAK